MSSLRFIHAAELGLDRPLAYVGTANAAHAARLHTAAERTFERVVQLCLDRQVEVLLLTCKPYNAAERPLPAHLRLCAGLERLGAAGIRVYSAPGPAFQQDAWVRALPWPANVHSFNADGEHIALDSAGLVTVSGLGQLDGVARPAGATFAIAMLPAVLDDAQLGRLEQAGFDYWALGGRRTKHMHQTALATVADPGPPLGLHAGESGPHGVCYVEVTEGHARIEYIPTAAVRWEQLTQDVDGLRWPEGVTRAAAHLIGALVAEPHEDILCELTLSGLWPLAHVPADPAALRELQGAINDRLSRSAPHHWCTRVTRQPRPSAARVERQVTGDAFAELLGVFDELRDDPTAAQAMWQQLDALTEDPRLAQHLPELSLTSAATRWAILDLAEGLATAETPARA